MADDVIVKFGGDATGVEQATGKAKAAVAGLTPEIKAHSDAVAQAAYNYGPWSGQMVDTAQIVGNTLVGSLGLAGTAFAALGAAAAAALAVISVHAVRVGEETGRLAGQFDQTTEAIGKLQGVSRRTGVSVEDLAQSMHDLKTNLKDEDADTGNALKALGVDADALKGKDIPGQMRVLAEAFSHTKDSADKAAIAEQIFGENWKDILPEMNKGVEHLDRMQAMAKRAGTSLSDDMVAGLRGSGDAAANVGFAFSELGESFSGLGLAIFSKIKPAVDGLMMGFSGLIESLAGVIQSITQAIGGTGALSTAFDALGTALKGIVTIVDGVILVFRGVVATVTLVGATISNVFVTSAEVAAGFGRDIIALGPKAFGALVQAAVAAAKAIMSPFVSVGEGIGKALTGDFAGAKAALANIGNNFGAEMDKAKAALGGLELTETKAAFARGLDRMDSDMKRFGASVTKATQDFQGQMTTIWSKEGAKREQIADRNAKHFEKGEGGKSGGKTTGDAARTAQLEIEGEIQALRAGLEQKKLMIEQDFITKKISEDQKVALVRAAVEEEYRAEAALLAKMGEIEGMKASQKQAVLNKIAQLENKHRTDMLQLDNQALQVSMRSWQNLFGSISQSISGSIMGMLNGTQTLKQAVANVAQSMIQSFLQAKVKMVADWAAGVAARMGLTTAEKANEVVATEGAEAAKTAAVAAGVAARTGAEATGSATSILSVIGNAFKSIMSSVGQTTAGVTGFMAPLVGPAAPAIGAASGAAIMAESLAFLPSYDVGSWQLDRDQLAMVHAGEMIVPSRGGVADEFRSFLGGGMRQQGQPPASQGDVHLHVHATDAHSVARMFKDHGNHLAKIVSDTFNANPKLRPSY